MLYRRCPSLSSSLVTQRICVIASISLRKDPPRLQSTAPAIFSSNVQLLLFLSSTYNDSVTTSIMSDPETYEEHCARTIREIVRNLLYVHNVHNLSAVQLSMFEDSLQKLLSYCSDAPGHGESSRCTVPPHARPDTSTVSSRSSLASRMPSCLMLLPSW